MHLGVFNSGGTSWETCFSERYWRKWVFCYERFSEALIQFCVVFFLYIFSYLSHVRQRDSQDWLVWKQDAGLDKGITMVVFDRGGFRYEGRVKAHRAFASTAVSFCILFASRLLQKLLALAVFSANLRLFSLKHSDFWRIQWSICMALRFWGGATPILAFAKRAVRSGCQLVDDTEDYDQAWSKEKKKRKNQKERKKKNKNKSKKRKDLL